jgi:hypothetical protein
MKVNISIEYHGQSATFEDVEIDDEKLVDESNSKGIELNDGIIWEDFINWVMVTDIERVK